MNGKYGSVALEVTDAGTGVVDAVINRVFSGIIADTMASIVKDVAGDIALVASSSNPQAQQGLLGAGSDVRMVVTGMKQAQAAIGEWQTATADAKDALAALRKTTPDLKESLESATTLLADVRTTVHAANSAYAGAMAEGGQEFKSLLSDISSRVKKASASIVSQTGDVETAIRNAESALVESEKLIATLKKLDPDSSTIASLERQTAALRDEVERLGTVSTEISEAADAASESSGAIADDIDAAIDDMKGSTDDFNRDILPQLDTQPTFGEDDLLIWTAEDRYNDDLMYIAVFNLSDDMVQTPEIDLSLYEATSWCGMEDNVFTKANRIYPVIYPHGAFVCAVK